MEFNKSVSNPMLIGAIELMKADDTAEHRNMFIEELVKADFLSPVIIDPAPTEDENGEITLAPESKIQIPMITNNDGARFFMAFTDMAEYEKWKEKNQELPVGALKLDEYAGMILRRDPQGNLCPALGMALNPYGANILLPREMLASLLTSRIAQAHQQMAGQMGQPIVLRPQAGPNGAEK